MIITSLVIITSLIIRLSINIIDKITIVRITIEERILSIITMIRLII